MRMTTLAVTGALIACFEAPAARPQGAPQASRLNCVAAAGRRYTNAA